MTAWEKKSEGNIEDIKVAKTASEPQASMKSSVRTPDRESNKPMVIMSETDAYIHERLKSQPQTLSEVEVKASFNNIDPTHILQLPKELESYKKKFAFRWLNKKKQSIDRALDVIGWNLVQRVLFNKLPDHLFTANGVIERGDAILAFMPEERAAVIRKRPGELSRERVRNLPFQDLKKWEDRGEKYYKPDLGSAEAESDAEYAKGNKGVVVQPDAMKIED